LPYIESSDVDETVRKATALGAKVMAGPSDIPGTGRYAFVIDPQGAAFGVYKSERPGGAWDGTNIVGRFSWHELMTTDHKKAWEFYRALFGWEKNGEMDMGGGQMYDMYGFGDKMYGGMFTTPPEMAGMHPFWLCYIHVKDVGKAVSIATKAGAKVHRPQLDIPGGSIAILGDPQGAGYAVHHANAPAAATESAKAATAPAKKPAKSGAKKSLLARAKGALKSLKKAVTKSPAKSPAKKSAKPAAAPKTKAKAKTKGAVKTKAKATKRPAAKAGAKAKAKSRAKTVASKKSASGGRRAVKRAKARKR
jgi:predicted enzyme related to lactoylglutathione lyase